MAGDQQYLEAMTRPLNPDELGAKGEAKFAELCLDARLTANKSDRDRVGWDYVVTWPLQTTGIRDRRPAPMVMHAQIKTVWAGNDSIELNLATLENIVKDARPAFIIIIEVGLDLSIAGIRVIHIAGEFLAEILKRWRKADAKETPSSGVTFSPSISKWGVALPEATGAALRAALEAVIPDGMSAYAARKTQELEELGYEDGRLHLSTTIEANSIDEVIDGFLGFRPLRVLKSSFRDMRFGIPLSAPGASWSDTSAEGALFLVTEPTSRGKRTMTITRKADGATRSFKVDIYSLSERVLGPGCAVVEARHRLFRFRFESLRRNGEPNVQVTFSTMLDDDALSARACDWATLYRVQSWVNGGPFGLKLDAPRKNGKPDVYDCAPQQPDLAKELAIMADAAEATEWVMLRAQAPDTRMTGVELAGAAAKMVELRALALSPDEFLPISFQTNAATSQAPEPEYEYEMLNLKRIGLGAHHIAYAVRTTMTVTPEGNILNWTSTQPQLAHVRKIKPNDEAFRRFAREASKLTGITSWMGPAVLGDKTPT